MAKKVFMSWHGGANYSVPYPGEAEPFKSLKAAKVEFERRLYCRRYPCVYRDTPDNGGPSARVFIRQEGEYPDFVLSFGPRGGLRCDPG